MIDIDHIYFGLWQISDDLSESYNNNRRVEFGKLLFLVAGAIDNISRYEYGHCSKQEEESSIDAVFRFISKES